MLEIRHNEKLLAIVDTIHAPCPFGLKFYGERDDYIQVGRFRHHYGAELRKHRHVPRPRMIEKTQEILIVLRGSVEAIVYGEISDEVIHKQLMLGGDYLISYWGGVGFRVLEEDTRMLEVKPGTYLVNDDNEERELL